MSRKWNIFDDQSNANYDAGNEIIYNTEVIHDYNDAYILVRGNSMIAGDIAAWVAFKNCAWFIKCITKINGTTTDDAEDLDLVVPMYNLLECSSNYSETCSPLFYSKDETADINNDITYGNNFRSLKYKTKLVRQIEAANKILENATTAVPLKHLSNF